MAFSPDGKTVVATAKNPEGEMQILLFSGDKNAKPAALATCVAEPFAFSADGKLLAAKESTKVRLFDLVEKAERPTNASQAYNGLGIADNGRAIATVYLGYSNTDTATLFDVDSGTPLKTLDLREGHSAKVSAVAFSPASPVFASADRDGTVLIRNWETGKLLARLSAHDTGILALGFSSDGKTLATAVGGKADVAARVWAVDHLK